MRVPFEQGLKGGVSDFRNRAVHSINGGADAAIADGRRQEAHAGMEEAGEQYVRFAVSNMLMRCAVESYRDRKQGPLLKRASSVFKTLTRGTFERLDIDFYQRTKVSLAPAKDGRHYRQNFDCPLMYGGVIYENAALLHHLLDVA